MRDYSRVMPSFWTGSTGRKIKELGAEGWAIASYLMTGPHANMIGLYRLPIAYVAADTGIPSEGVRKVFRSLTLIGFAHYDDAEETVWVPEMAHYQMGETVSSADNRHKPLVKEIEKHRKSCYFGAFVDKYRAAFNLPFEGPTKVFESHPEALAKPLPSQKQEQKQEKEQNQEHQQEESEAPPPEPDEPAPSGPPIAEVIRGFESRYPESLPAEARHACALSRRNGKLADSVWLRTLEQLATHPVDASTHAMRTFVEKYGDGEKDERYLLGIARTESKRGGRSKGPAPPATREAHRQFVAKGGNDDFDRDVMQGVIGA